MSLGEPDFNTPAHVKAAAREAIDADYTHYTPVPGSLSLKEAIVGKLQKENGLTYTPAEILVSNGAKQSLCNAIMALIDEGDEVIIPAPYWVSYPQMVLLAGGKPVHVDTGIDQDYKMTPSSWNRRSLRAPGCSYSARPAIRRAPCTRRRNWRPSPP